MLNYPVIIVNDLVRSQYVARALARGIPNAKVIHSNDWASPVGFVCIHYGLFDKLRDIMQQNITAGIPDVLIDLGYFGRLDGATRWVGYHRYAVGTFHGPLVAGPCSWERIGRWLPEVVTSPRLGHILLVGMSPKAEQVYKLGSSEWDCYALEEIRKYTNRPVWYYPKPRSHLKPRSKHVDLPLTKHWVGLTHDEAVDHWKFNRAHCVVAHHSNLTTKAQVFGIPIIAADGVAKYLSTTFENIDFAVPPDIGIRRDFLARLGYNQWNLQEMSDGSFWAHLKSHLESLGLL